MRGGKRARFVLAFRPSGQVSVIVRAKIVGKRVPTRRRSLQLATGNRRTFAIPFTRKIRRAHRHGRRITLIYDFRFTPVGGTPITQKVKVVMGGR